MASIEIQKNSWLNFADLLELDGVTFWDTPDFPPIVPQEDDVYVTIDDSNQARLDLIASDAYGDPDLWWVIALANNMDLVPVDAYINRRIRIPSQTFVNSLIAKGGQKI